MCILISYVKEDDIVCHKPKRLQERTNLSILENSLPLNMYTMLDLSKTYKVNVFPRMFYLFDEIELVNKSRQTTYVHKVTVGNIYQVNHISEESYNIFFRVHTISPKYTAVYLLVINRIHNYIYLVKQPYFKQVIGQRKIESG